jgi:hypothetical protein
MIAESVDAAMFPFGFQFRLLGRGVESHDTEWSDSGIERQTR